MADNSAALAALLMSQQGRPAQQYDPFARQRRYAEALMTQGASTAPVQSPLEGIARALTGGVGGYFAGEADRSETERRRSTTTGLLEYANATTPEEKAAAQAKLQDADPNIVGAIAAQLIGQKMSAERGATQFNAIGGVGGQPGVGGPQQRPLTIDINKPTASPDNAAFIQSMSPQARAAAQATGLDPRVVLAQTALETGYGQSVPGNNYFGIKGPGQVQGTQEADANGRLVPTQDSFKTYPNVDASTADYANVMRQPNMAGVLQAPGMTGQIAALGKSGYATDPNYAQKVGAIAGQLSPLDPTDPTSAFAMGRPALQGPATASGTPINPNAQPPSFMQPQPQVAQAPGTPPVTVQATPPSVPPIATTPEISPQAQQLDQAAQRLAAAGSMDEAKAMRMKAQEVQAAYAAERSKTADTRTYEQQIEAQKTAAANAEHDRRKAAEDANKPLTKEQADSAGYHDRMKNAGSIIDQFEAGGKPPSLGSTIGKNIPIVGAMTQKPANQDYNAAKLDWISSQLRRETGANMPASEVAEMERRYFPQPGEGPEIIKHKAQARAVAEEAMKRGAGANYVYKPGPAQTLAGTTAPVKVASPEEARKLPKGTPIQLPDGSIGAVP